MNTIKQRLAALLLCIPVLAQAEGPLLTGEVAVKNAEVFYAPRVGGWQIQIEWMMPEGQIAKPDELVVLFARDSIDADIEIKEADLLKKRDQLKLARITGKESIREAEFALERTRLEHDKAKIEAGIGIDYVSRYDHEKAGVELEKSRTDMEKSKRQLATEKDKVETDIEKKLVDIKKTENELAELKRKSGLTALKTRYGGPMVYASHPWNGSKINSGSSVQATWKVAEIAAGDQMRVVAWLNEVDKGSIAVNDKVAIEVDAMPGKNLQGVVSHIVPQSETREAWGTAAYFKVEIEFDDHNMATALALVPGMSVLVEKLP